MRVPQCDKLSCPVYASFDRCYVPIFRFCIDYSRQENKGDHYRLSGEGTLSVKLQNPADTYEQIELTEGLEEAFQRHHPHLYHILQTKLWGDYKGL